MSTTKRIIRQIFGWLFLILGFLGLFLPILQGILFIVIGVLLLSADVPFFGRILQRLKARYPKLARRADKLTQRFSKD